MDEYLDEKEGSTDSKLCVDHDKSHDLNLMHCILVTIKEVFEHCVTDMCAAAVIAHLSSQLHYQCAKFHNASLGKMRPDCTNFLCSEHV